MSLKGARERAAVRAAQSVTADGVIEIHKNHLEDDQTGMLKTEPQRAGARMFQLRERVAFQLLTQSSDAALLPSIPNCPDGVALYSATDGDGAARFGVTGGNLITGQTMNSAATIRAGVFAALIRIGQFKDTKSQPIYTDGEIKDVVLFAPFSVYDLYLEAFKWELAAGRAVAAADAMPNDALSDYFRQNKFKLRIFPTTRITTATDCHVVVNVGKYRAIKWQPRTPMALTPHPENSGDSFETGYLKWKAEERWGMGLGLPINQVLVQA